MGYKAILTYLDRTENSKAQFANAIQLAKQFDATLTTIATAANQRVSADELDQEAGEQTAGAGIYDQAQSIAALHAEQAMQDCDAADIRYSVKPFVPLDDEWRDEFGRHARYSDLVVLAPINGETGKRTASNALEAALYAGGVPVLICPPEMRVPAPETVLIGWNGSAEAMRSVRAALPMLRHATTIDIAIIDQPDSERSSAEDLAGFLGKHGIDASVSPLSSNLKTIDETLRARAAEIGAGLIVMGAYSRSWFREYFLGGVTKEIIARPTVPVLLTH